MQSFRDSLTRPFPRYSSEASEWWQSVYSAYKNAKRELVLESSSISNPEISDSDSIRIHCPFKKIEDEVNMKTNDIDLSTVIDNIAECVTRTKIIRRQILDFLEIFMKTQTSGNKTSSESDSKSLQQKGLSFAERGLQRIEQEKSIKIKTKSKSASEDTDQEIQSSESQQTVITPTTIGSDTPTDNSGSFSESVSVTASQIHNVNIPDLPLWRNAVKWRLYKEKNQLENPESDHLDNDKSTAASATVTDHQESVPSDKTKNQTQQKKRKQALNNKPVGPITLFNAVTTQDARAKRAYAMMQELIAEAEREQAQQEAANANNESDNVTITDNKTDTGPKIVITDLTLKQKDSESATQQLLTADSEDYQNSDTIDNSEAIENFETDSNITTDDQCHQTQQGQNNNFLTVYSDNNDPNLDLLETASSKSCTLEFSPKPRTIQSQFTGTPTEQLLSMMRSKCYIRFKNVDGSDGLQDLLTQTWMKYFSIWLKEYNPKIVDKLVVDNSNSRSDSSDHQVLVDEKLVDSLIVFDQAWDHMTENMLRYGDYSNGTINAGSSLSQNNLSKSPSNMSMLSNNNVNSNRTRSSLQLPTVAGMKNRLNNILHSPRSNKNDNSLNNVDNDSNTGCTTISESDGNSSNQPCIIPFGLPGQNSSLCCGQSCYSKKQLCYLPATNERVKIKGRVFPHKPRYCLVCEKWFCGYCKRNKLRTLKLPQNYNNIKNKNKTENFTIISSNTNRYNEPDSNASVESTGDSFSTVNVSNSNSTTTPIQNLQLEVHVCSIPGSSSNKSNSNNHQINPRTAGTNSQTINYFNNESECERELRRNKTWYLAKPPDLGYGGILRDPALFVLIMRGGK